MLSVQPAFKPPQVQLYSPMSAYETNISSQAVQLLSLMSCSLHPETCALGSPRWTIKPSAAYSSQKLQGSTHAATAALQLPPPGPSIQELACCWQLTAEAWLCEVSFHVQQCKLGQAQAGCNDLQTA